MKLKIVEDIRTYFRVRSAERKWEQEKDRNRYALHNKKKCYIDSLQFVIGRTVSEMNNLPNHKAVISNYDAVEGYYVAVGSQVYDDKKKIESVKPDLTIILDAKSIDDMVLTMWNDNRSSILLQFPIRSDDDYKNAKHTICDYLHQNLHKPK